MTDINIQPLKIDTRFDGGLIHRSPVLNNSVVRCICWGASGSGKTRFICSFLTQMMHEPLGGVFITAKAHDQAPYKSLEKWAEKKGFPYEITDELDKELFDKIMEEEAPKTVIIDDLAGDDCIIYLKKLYKFGRHKNVNICCLNQDYRSIPREVKNNINLCIIFPLGSPFVARSVINGMCSFCDGEALKNAYRFITAPDFKHSCIFLNLYSDSNYIFLPDGKILDMVTLQPANINKEAPPEPQEKRGKGRPRKKKIQLS